MLHVHFRSFNYVENLYLNKRNSEVINAYGTLLGVQYCKDIYDRMAECPKNSDICTLL